MAKKKTYYDYLRQELGGLIEQLQLPTLYQRSLQQRWLDQVVWADKKAAECRRRHYQLRLTTVIGSVVLPALVGINFQLANANPTVRVWFPYVPFVLSQVIAVSAAIEEFCRFGDRWRDYRQVAEDLKAEGWQYLQLSGPYQVSEADIAAAQAETAEADWQTGLANSLRSRQSRPVSTLHLKHYALFASRVEDIIKQDVKNYISELVKQQAKQEQQIEQYLESAETVAKDKTLFAQATPMPPARPGMAAPAYPGAGAPYGQPMPPGYAAAPPLGMPMAAVAYPPPAPPPAPPLAAPPPPAPPYIAPPAPATSPAAGQTADLNAAILAAANQLRGMSTADGPGGGNVACAWTLNQVLRTAGIPALGENPNFVPSLLEALQQGRGRQVSSQEAKAGDLVVACGEEHIGIGLDQGCSRVLSNSSSRAAFVWESDLNFDGFYNGPSTIYRLLH